mgnify:CR=1 FL=1
MLSVLQKHEKTQRSCLLRTHFHGLQPQIGVDGRLRHLRLKVLDRLRGQLLEVEVAHQLADLLLAEGLPEQRERAGHLHPPVGGDSYHLPVPLYEVSDPLSLLKIWVFCCRKRAVLKKFVDL